MSIKKILKYIGAKAKQPSTWAGIGVIGSIFGGPAVGVAVSKIGAAAGLILGGGLVGHGPTGTDG